MVARIAGCFRLHGKLFKERVKKVCHTVPTSILFFFFSKLPDPNSVNGPSTFMQGGQGVYA